MIKILSVVVLLTTSIFAQNFEQFLDNAIKNSPYLKASNLGIEQATQSGEALTRYINPTLEVEMSNFSPDIGNSDTGYRASYSQPIRLWGVGNDKDALSLAMNENASALYKLNKANFVKNISLLYRSYANNKKLLELGYEELSIAEGIYNISKQRHEAGTISQGLKLQAKVEYEMVKVRIQNVELNLLNSYYILLQGAGSSQEVEFELKHKFLLIDTPQINNNPDIKFIKSKQKKSLSQAQVNSNAVEWVSLVAEYEAEPNQSIVRLGASLPLAFFNTKSQEKRISKLESDKSELISNNEKTKLKMEILRLTKQRETFLKIKKQNEEILKTQVNLLKMFEDGYKIASVNLLQLQSIKNNVIETKENIIKLDTALDKNAITTNYIAGAYND